MADLNEILMLLSPEAIAEKVSLHFELARERHKVEQPVVADYEEFTRRFGGFYSYMFSASKGLKTQMPEDFALGHAWQLLESSYRGGVEGAYRDARTGMNGGLIGIFNKIAEKMRKDAEQNYIQHILRTHVNPLNFDEIVDLCRQYLKRFGGHIPAEMQPRSPAELAANWQELITTHAQVLSEIRRAAGKLP